ncbi:MAG: thermonuclease family protein [Nitrospirae bacterium]|nr:thermonuclease family protein [Nitrospirota bacterium]
MLRSSKFKILNPKQILIPKIQTPLIVVSVLISALITVPFVSLSNAQSCDYYVVSRVIDGDTFEISDSRKIRLIGIDTPETVDPREDVQWFGREASKKLKEWISDKKVCLKKDIDETKDTDKYGRLLRYVWRDKFFVNAELVKQGYAFAYTAYPFQYMEDFRRYEKQARGNNRGLWDKTKQEAWEKEVEKNKLLVKTCGQDKTICPDDARKHIGKYKTVRFYAAKSYDSGNAVFLNSKNDFKDADNFTAVIFKEDKRKFSKDPADYYWGKTIDVSGKISEKEGRAEIILQRQSQIKILRRF